MLHSYKVTNVTTIYYYSTSTVNAWEIQLS